MTGLLVVAGEASGDRAAAHVTRRLAATFPGLPMFGVGGNALRETGVELVADLDEMTALGVGGVVARAAPIARAHAHLLRAAKERKPRAALLVDYTEFNTRVADVLHRAGVRVLWYVAPQVWAWRAGRIPKLRRSVDRMAVIFPFEEPLWRERGVDAHYVGHPAYEARRMTREEARAALDMTPYASAVAILPGSRPHEVRRLLPVFLAAYDRVRRDRASVDARVLLAPSLDAATVVWAEERASEHHVATHHADPYDGAVPLLPAFDVALSASGTATLEATLARAIPVVAYRTGLVTEAVARALVKIPHLALPNVLLGRRAFDELLQRDARPERVARALARALDFRHELLGVCDEVEACLGPERAPSREVARLLHPWLAAFAS